jgi:hypothetical protein
LLSNSNHANILLETHMAKKDVQQGTLALMVLKTLTRAGRKQLQAETKDREATASVIERFFAMKAEDLQ